MASKRLNKRQAREQQELEELAAAKATAPSATAPSDEEDEEETAAAAAAPTSKPAAASIFAALNAGDDSDEGQESDDDDDDEAQGKEEVAAPSTKKKKNRKKKKKSKAAKPVGEGDEGQADDSAGAAAAAASTAPQQTSSKKSKKASSDKAANATAKGISDMSLDDFDSLLSSQPHMKAGGGVATGAGAAAGPSNAGPSYSSPASSLRSCLSLSPSHLDPSIELKRQFGSAAIKAFEASGGADGAEGGGGGGAAAGRAARGTRARMMARNANLKARSVLVQPREDWPPIARTFTGIQGETRDEDDEKVATWTHSKAYLTAQYEFQAAVATYDPNSLYALFRPYPWHIHLLSSLSDIAKHQGDLSQAADWNARILFAYERTAAPQWVGSLTGPSAPLRVDFDKAENRPLWLAAHRNVGFLGRRGTWRTALEWAKLLLALEPRQDPHGALLWIDFLAVKSGQNAWFVDEFLPALEKSGSGARKWMGGLAFAEALAVRAIETDAAKKKNSSSAATARPPSAPSSTELLKRAIAQHSYMLPALASKISLPPLPPSLANIEVDGVHEILAQLYALRSGESLWKDADNREWLGATLRGFEEDGGKAQQPPAQPTDLEAQGVYRHVIAGDLPDALRTSLLSCLPRAVARDEANLNAHDPLPPAKKGGRAGSGVTRIDEDYFAPMFRTTAAAASGPSASRGAVGGGADDSEMGEGIMNRLAAFAAGRLRGWFQQQQGGEGEGEGRQEEGAQGDLQEALMAALGSLPEAERDAMRRIIEEGAGQERRQVDDGEGSEDDDDEDYEEVLDSEDEEERR